MEIYIGDSLEWADNPKCPEGPFLRTDDSSNYYEWFSSAGSGEDWAFGIEAWCNMPGRYTTVVADYSSIMSTYLAITPSICDFAVLGTRYIRDDPVPEQIELNAG